MSLDVKYVVRQSYIFIYIYIFFLPLITTRFFEIIFTFFILFVTWYIVEIFAKEFHLINNENNFISLELPETSVSTINICIYATVYRLFTSFELVNPPVPRLSRMTRLYEYPLTTMCACVMYIIFINAYSCALHIERSKEMA